MNEHLGKEHFRCLNTSQERSLLSEGHMPFAICHMKTLQEILENQNLRKKNLVSQSAISASMGQTKNVFEKNKPFKETSTCCRYDDVIKCSNKHKKSKNNSEDAGIKLTASQCLHNLAKTCWSISKSGKC